AQDTALSTDRPGQLFSAQVVGPGVWQLESRIAHTGDEEGDDLGLFGAGVTYLMSEDPQLDAAFDAGLTDAAPDLQVGVGLSVRF
ncbi:MAG: transporter, partial [Thermoanaerobaculia bacterium]